MFSINLLVIENNIDVNETFLKCICILILGEPDEINDATTQAQDDQEYDYGNH